MKSATLQEIRDGALAVSVSAVVGLPAGLIWWLVAPSAKVQKRADGLYRAGGEGDESVIGADMWFGAVTAVIAIVVAYLIYRRTQPARLGPLLGLTRGGVSGAIIAWQTGAFLGPGAIVDTARGLRVGAVFDSPLAVNAAGMLLAWPLVAVITYFAAVAGHERHDAPVDDDASMAPAADAMPAVADDMPEAVSPYDPAAPPAPH